MEQGVRIPIRQKRWRGVDPRHAKDAQGIPHKEQAAEHAQAFGQRRGSVMQIHRRTNEKEIQTKPGRL